MVTNNTLFSKYVIKLKWPSAYCQCISTFYNYCSVLWNRWIMLVNSISKNITNACLSYSSICTRNFQFLIHDEVCLSSLNCYIYYKIIVRVLIMEYSMLFINFFVYLGFYSSNAPFLIIQNMYLWFGNLRR